MVFPTGIFPTKQQYPKIELKTKTHAYNEHVKGVIWNKQQKETKAYCSASHKMFVSSIRNAHSAIVANKGNVTKEKEY